MIPPQGTTGQSRPGPQRKGLLLSVAAFVVVLAVALTVTFWPRGSSGGPDGAGGASPADARARGESAAQVLGKLPGLRFSAVYAPSGGEPVTRAEMTVTAQGEATGTLRAPVTGKAAMAWSGDQLYLKGDDDFWAQQSPHYGNDLTSSGHWVKPEKRDGYYMLDSFGVNAGSLTPKSMAAVVRQVTSDPSVVQEDAGTRGGRRVTSYTAQNRMVVLTSDAPYTVVAVGINPADTSPIETAAWHSSVSSRMQSAGQRIVPAASGDDSDIYNPYLFTVPKPATDKQTAAAHTAAAQAADAAVPPASTEEAVADKGPDFTVTSNDPSLCTTKPCSYSFSVTNKGDEAAEATLHVRFPGTPDRTHPLGMMQPHETKEVGGTRPNIARPGETVRHTDYVWVYTAAVYGHDQELAKRLQARELDPANMSYAAALKPKIAKLLDLMTQGTAVDDTKANENAVEAISSANHRGQLPLLAAIAESGRLSNTKDLAGNVIKAYKADNPGDMRVLEQIAHLMKTDPNAKVIYDGPYEINGVRYKTDYMVISRTGGEEVKKAFQVKTVRSKRNLPENVNKGGEQLNGEGGASSKDDSGPESAPPGFKRVLQINVEPSFTDLFQKSTADLENLLFETRKFAKVRENLCKQRKDGKGPRIEQLIIVNGAGTHAWDDLTKLCNKDE
ncbi:hypothetical protein ACIBK8_24065 [Streptomyces sp. NPDC050161]|uniref:hypothetical protein n=1 Tax=Streptomyces sp. NPDC050161 TaxID=3365604 RepID=UPI0037A33B65